MKLVSKTWLIVLASMLSVSSSYGKKVTLDSCRNMAVHNNKTLQAADETIKSAGYANKAAKAAYLPGIDFTGAYMLNQHKISLLKEDAKLPTMFFDPITQKYQYDLLINPETGKPVIDPETGTPVPLTVAVIPKKAMEFDTRNIFAGAITLTQPIYMGGQIRAMNDITKYAEEIARTQRNAAVQDVVYAVDEAYWGVVSLCAKKRLAESFVNLVDTLKYNVKAMYDEGVATRSDVLTVEVKDNEARITLSKVNNGLTLSRMALAQLCGLPLDEEMTLADEELQHTDTIAPVLSYNLPDVYASRQDLATVRHSISMLEAQEKLALGDMLPKVALVGAYSFSNPNTISGFEKKFGGGFSVGVTVTVPIWHWGGNYNKYRASKSLTAAQRITLSDLEEKVALQAKQAKFKYDEAYKTYDMTRTNMQKADENLRQANIGFKEGVLTADDVILAQTAWLQAHSEQIDAEIGVQLCRVYLNKVLGTMPY